MVTIKLFGHRYRIILKKFLLFVASVGAFIFYAWLYLSWFAAYNGVIADVIKNM